MEMNWLIHVLAAVVPLAVGALWYGPLFGKTWMRLADMTEEKIKGGNMALIMILSFVLSFMLTIMLNYLVHHELGLEAIFRPIEKEGLGLDKASETGIMLTGMIEEYTLRFSTFKHGAFHGVLTSIFIVLPIMTIKAMFERKSAAFIFLNWGYWLVTLTIMSGILCQWA